jgi:hypothetical protein
MEMRMDRYSLRKIYRLWMRFAELLHSIAVAVLFGGCYLLIVPVFFLISRPFDPLRLRGRADAKSYWIKRRRGDVDLRSLQRGG